MTVMELIEKLAGQADWAGNFEVLIRHEGTDYAPRRVEGMYSESHIVIEVDQYSAD